MIGKRFIMKMAIWEVNATTQSKIFKGLIKTMSAELKGTDLGGQMGCIW